MPTRVSKPASLGWLVHGQWLPSLYYAADAFVFFEMTLNCFPKN
jgi:hypothetical protein